MTGALDRGLPAAGPAVTLTLLAGVAARRAWSRRALPRRRLATCGSQAAAPRRRWPVPPWLVPALAAAAVLASGAGAVLATLAGVGTAALPALRRRRRQALAVREAADALPDVVDALARSLRSGASLPQAVGPAARGAPERLAAELDAVATAIGRGRPVAAAFDAWAEASCADGAGLVAAAVALLGDAGGDAALALDNVAATLRDRRTNRREVAALSAQATSSAAVLAVAPAGFGAVAAAVDPATARFLLATPGGLLCLTAGVGLDLVGWRWMRRITATAAVDTGRGRRGGGP